MTNLFDKYDQLSLLAHKAENDRRSAVVEIVKTLQSKTEKGYIEFDDETTYPPFYDTTIDEYETIVGAKVVNDTLYLISDGNDFETTTNWFNWEHYGDLDLDEFVYILEHNLNIV